MHFNLENLSSGAHPSACSSHRARAHVPEFISHATSMSRTARHAPAVARHLIPAPSAVRSSPALHSVLLHVTSFRQHRSPGIGRKPTLARAVSSSIPRRAVPFGRPASFATRTTCCVGRHHAQPKLTSIHTRHRSSLCTSPQAHRSNSYNSRAASPCCR
jgi:hypothetical protein